MLEILLAVRVLDVKVAAVFQDVSRPHFPSTLVLFAILPPRQAGSKLLVLQRLGLGVLLPPFGQWLLVVPDLFRRPGPVKEKQVRRDAGVRRKDAVGQAHDGVQGELLEQFLLDAGANSVAKEGAIGYDDARPAKLGWALELAHDEL